MTALNGIKVIELAGLAPGPFCGMILADFGAKVIRVDRIKAPQDASQLGRGKLSIAVNLKKTEGVAVVRKLCKSADVLIEPFRAGVMEKLGLGPKILLADNPSLVYARLTGFGQSGPYAQMAGHDINYLAVAGVLSTLGRKDQNPTPPVNILADMAGGGMTCALGITMALLERNKSGLGQVIDSNMVEGSAYLSSFLWKTQDNQWIWNKPRGGNVLDSGAHFYDTYKTKDGLYMAVGAIEPQFYSKFIEGLGLSSDSNEQYSDWDEMKEKIAKIFATKTRDEWCQIFDGTDACVTPVLGLEEAASNPHNKSKQTFLSSPNGKSEPIPAPRLSRTPGMPSSTSQPHIGEHTRQVLYDAGYSEKEVDQLENSEAVECHKHQSKL
ncbi:alpha-methylacyl-CoA racemase isoform X2 [Lingula anatina]|uniref:Alpha-methylacyl-CoA racemase isoform X1 n=1 Tax=Lingula anatina TaxID=7574 RepID=A0A1S3JZQ2_LINAN|nr:alpha-methylacyl-CoA racemase isoform X1 [Lingula anatina]XP_013415869.1 alpha-methylacyl-CoA racemase isoform X1 [Lingula anatina]XP_013415871.1 alpha-methylacyl-CoA racemase isoform X2 [Lingula anatina]XP_023933152.1 alpha-methylacyl-CoA racemase isoform X2 [Lingula anatina]|eukprot:XP_013415868.1 alpha-methylacyl-CoA racemase isoform X1 [Lingula anatina]